MDKNETTEQLEKRITDEAIKRAAAQPKPGLDESIDIGSVLDQNSGKMTEEQKQAAFKLVKEAAKLESQEMREASDDSWCKTEQDLIVMIGKYITYNTKKEHRGTRLYELNRRFGITARKLGSTVKKMATKATDQDLASWALHRGLWVFYDSAILVAAQWDVKTLDEKDELRTKYLDQAFDALKR